MLRVHHLNMSRSQTIIWLLEELSRPYEIVFYRRDRKTMRAPATLKKIHPLGKAPVLEDDTMVLAESGVIVDYLITNYGPHFAPAADHPHYWRYQYWLHYAEGSLMSQLVMKLIADKLGLLALPIKGMMRQQLDLQLDFLEAEAKKSPWLAGDQISGADIIMGFPLEVAARRGGLNESRPALWRLLQTLQQRPAYARAKARWTDNPA